MRRLYVNIALICDFDNLTLMISEKLLQRGFPASVPRGAADQAAAAGLHHPHPAVDLRAELQGSALQL